MKLRGLGRLRQAGTALRFHLNNRAVVLLYHRVTEPGMDPQLLAVSPENFASHLEVIRKTWAPLSLRELVTAIRRKQVPHRGVVVTFDDGYADNLALAQPLMEKHGVPGTVFVTSGALGGVAQFWWDELACLLLDRTDLPSSVEARIGGVLCKWKLANSSRLGKDSMNAPSWSVLCPSDPTPAHAAYRDLCTRVRPLDIGEREAVLGSLREQLGADRTRESEDKAMTRAEVKKLADGGRIEIGAHTVSHVLLSAMTPDRQLEEVAQSKRTLEEITELPVGSFSYPFGGRQDYSGETIEMVRGTGFNCACSNFEGVVTRATDIFQIPRFLVRNWDGPTFAAKLDEWISRPRA